MGATEEVRRRVIEEQQNRCKGECADAEDFYRRELPAEVLEYFEKERPPRAVVDFIVDNLNELLTEEARQAQFVSDVSHEIRTPLTAIRGTAETLLDGGVPEDLQNRFLSQIINECDRLTRLANDLLTLQKAEGQDMELSRLNLRTVAENCALLMGELLDERGVQLEVTGETPDIMGNTDAINQILVNLIENASRYAHSRVQVQLAAAKDWSFIAVKDDGPGFGDVDPAHLFDRFYRADQSRARHKGTGNSGLGLAIVKALAQAMNGSVEAANIPGGGAAFIIAIPSLPPEGDEEADDEGACEDDA